MKLQMGEDRHWDDEIKIITVGAYDVGKSSLIQKYLNKNFVEKNMDWHSSQIATGNGKRSKHKHTGNTDAQTSSSTKNKGPPKQRKQRQVKLA